jgi:CBS domain-containing protein
MTPETPLATLLERFATVARARFLIPSSAPAACRASWAAAVDGHRDGERAPHALAARRASSLPITAPIHAEANLGLAALAALLAETDSRRLADGFVIVSSGRYVGMGTAGDVVRSLQSSRVLAARYTNPLTMLPGQVPINEHLERLLAGRVPFTAWFVEVDQMRGVNDSEGFTAGDAVDPRDRAVCSKRNANLAWISRATWPAAAS